MVGFMLSNPGLAGGKFQKLHGKLESNKKWSELADSLNCLGGAVKSVVQWRMVWKDLKSRTSAKVRDRKKQQALTGNNPITQESLTELEGNVVSIIGNSVCENVSENAGHNLVCENVSENAEPQILLEIGEFDLKLPASPIQNEDEFEESMAPSSSKRPLKRKRVDESESKFLKIAEKQSDALKMMAETNAANLEVNKAMTEAMKTMDEGLKAVAEAFNNFANTINKNQVLIVKRHTGKN